MMHGSYLELKRSGDRVRFSCMNADGTCEYEQNASVEEAEEFLIQLTGMAPHEAAALLVDTKAH